MSSSQFIHIRNYTQYSLSLGALRINDLINYCIKNKSPAIGISDKNNLFGSMEFSLDCVKHGVQPIISCDLSVVDENYNSGNILLTVSSKTGYESLSKLVTLSYLSENRTNNPFITFDELSENNDGLICLSGGKDGLINNNYLNLGKDKSLELINNFLSIFKNNFFFEIQRIKKLEVDPYIEFLVNLSLEKKIPLIATNENYFLEKKFHESHDALICISQQKYIDSENRKKINVESFLKKPNEMVELFEDLPNAISNTLKLSQRCSFLLKEKEPNLPKVSGKLNEDDILRNNSLSGLEDKFKIKKILSHEKDNYKKRLHYELGVISKMGYSGYFLIVSDFIQWAKKNKIPVGPGRGSGAGSLVAWCLTITDLDPIRFGLLFERFLNPERVSMPDFDIDFCMDKRDEVIKYVQEKYRHDCVAQIITFGSFQARVALRDVGRVLQIPYDQVDKLCKLIPYNPAKPTSLKDVVKYDKKIKEIINRDKIIEKLFEISIQLEGLLRHASTHAAGVVISDKPLVEILPLYKDSNSSFPVTQFSMKYVEKVGLVKFDFLGLKTLTVIEKTCKLLEEKNININLDSLPFDDEKTFKILKSGQTVGIFQFDGKGMRDTIIQIKPDRFEDLIAIVSLYRPGPMDNIPLYIKRKKTEEAINYIHEDLKEILDETYGIMVYQEQVMQIAQKLAGFSLAKADLLRRAMGKKIKAEMESQKINFIEGCANNNIKKNKAENLFDEIEKFAGYGFNKSHAAAYALISYQTAYLKANYPMEFLCASMECEINNIDKLGIFCKEVKNLGFKIFKPDINKSHESFKVVYDKSEAIGINYALGAIKNIGENSIKYLVNDRKKSGKFSSLIDLLKRIDNAVLNKRQLESLIFSGAMNSIETNQFFLEKNLEKIIKFNSNFHKNINKFQGNLFDQNHFDQSQFNSKGFKKWDTSTILKKEYESIGFYLSKHPIEHFENFYNQDSFSKLNFINDFIENNQNKNMNFSSLVIVNNIIQRKSKLGKKYAFFSFSDDTSELEVICFSETLDNLIKVPNLGDLCIINLEIIYNDESARLVLKSLKKIESDKALVNYKLMIEVNLASVDLNNLNLILSKRNKGNNSLSFLVKDDDLNLLIKSKENFSLDLDFLNDLKEIQGITKISKIN